MASSGTTARTTPSSPRRRSGSGSLRRGWPHEGRDPFHHTYATFTHDWGLTVTLEGRPEWVEKALDAVCAAMGKIDPRPKRRTDTVCDRCQIRRREVPVPLQEDPVPDQSSARNSGTGSPGAAGTTWGTQSLRLGRPSPSVTGVPPTPGRHAPLFDSLPSPRTERDRPPLCGI